MKNSANPKSAILFLLCNLLLLPTCSNKKTNNNQQEEEKVEQVKTMTLKKRPINRQIKISANLLGYETIHISPTSLNTIIEKIFVAEGTQVQEGDQLVRMDQTNYKNTKIAIANLKTEMQRLEALLETGSVSQQTYDQTKVTYDQTKENLDYIRENTFVKSPVSGVVTEKHMEDGELYSGASPILDIAIIDKLKAIIAVPETYLPLVKKNMPITIYTEIYPDREFFGSIELIYPTIDPSTHTFQCKVVIPNKNHILKPGMYVTTTLNIGKGYAIAVPYQSVEKLVGSNERYVFLNESGRAKRVSVQLGQRIDEDIEIIAPEIVEGAQYVYVGQYKLVDGAKLNVVE